MNWGSWLDEYDREARLVPGLSVLLPLVLAIVGLGFGDSPMLGSVIGILVALGGPMAIAKHVANRGRQVEATLFKKWGGPPTTLLLAPPEHAPMGEIRRQRRQRLETLSGITLPTSTEPTAHDAETYRAATLWLLTNTRDRSRFPVVWNELKSYGFERNLLGLRGEGLLASTVAAGSLAAGLVAGLVGANVPALPAGLLCTACLVIGLGWWAVPNERRVRVVADRYAERLLDATAALP